MRPFSILARLSLLTSAGTKTPQGFPNTSFVRTKTCRNRDVPCTDRWILTEQRPLQQFAEIIETWD
jgi:hypothetical protein